MSNDGRTEREERIIENEKTDIIRKQKREDEITETMIAYRKSNPDTSEYILGKIERLMRDDANVDFPQALSSIIEEDGMVVEEREDEVNK